MAEITLADFKKIELKVAKILQAEEIPGADKLWRLVVDTGGSQKQLVAGIKPYYSQEALIGRSIVIVDNLAPVTLRGVESRGMLLAAKDGTDLGLVTVDRDIPPGSSVS